ncbi:MAG: hypothetical protein BWX70_03460 [Verrucomicrobia bacterium ADurb.Bin070]|nr:MAG: hypothetical protein BWX70_03460 [Verrucomicrobia bacterium ADurb.Bin070]
MPPSSDTRTRSSSGATARDTRTGGSWARGSTPRRRSRAHTRSQALRGGSIRRLSSSRSISSTSRQIRRPARLPAARGRCCTARRSCGHRGPRNRAGRSTGRYTARSGARSTTTRPSPSAQSTCPASPPRLVRPAHVSQSCSRQHVCCRARPAGGTAPVRLRFSMHHPALGSLTRRSQSAPMTSSCLGCTRAQTSAWMPCASSIPTRTETATARGSIPRATTRLRTGRIRCAPQSSAPRARSRPTLPVTTGSPRSYTERSAKPRGKALSSSTTPAAACRLSRSAQSSASPADVPSGPRWRPPSHRSRSM